MKTFEAEPQSSSILGLNWNVDTDSLIVCRGTEQEVPAKNNSENCPILCLSSVRPTWDMFTIPHTNAVSTQKHLAQTSEIQEVRRQSCTMGSEIKDWLSFKWTPTSEASSNSCDHSK